MGSLGHISVNFPAVVSNTLLEIQPSFADYRNDRTTYIIPIQKETIFDILTILGSFSL